jgi:N12 class adenine-specific DNA methylase
MKRSVPHVIECENAKTAGSRFCIDTRIAGKRVREFFATKTAAEKKLREITTKIRREGEEALECPNALRIEAMQAAAALALFPGATITKAVELYLNHLKVARLSVPVRQLITEFLEAKAQDKELSKFYVDDLRLRLGRFSKDFGDVGTRQLETKDIEEWIWGLKLSSRVRRISKVGWKPCSILASSGSTSPKGKILAQRSQSKSEPGRSRSSPSTK